MNDLLEKLPQIIALVVALCASAFLIAVTYRAVRWIVG